MSGVENLIYRATDGGEDIDLANFASVTSFTLDRPVAGVDVAGVALTDTVVISQLSATSDTTLTYGGTLTGAADASAITINGATAGADLELSGDVETITVNVGAATSLADLVLDAGTTTLVVNADANLTVATTLTSTGLTSLTATGAGNLTLTPNLDAATVSVNGAAATGNINVKAGNVAEAAVGTTDFTFTGGVGNDTLDLSATDGDDEIQISMGAGNDLVILDEVTVKTTADAIDGGDGDDTLRYTGSTTLDADFSTQVSNIETLEVAATATITMAALDEFAPKNYKSTVADGAAGNSRVVLSMDGLATGSTITLDAAAAAVTRDAADNDGVELNVSLTTDGLADSITINFAESYEEISDDAEDDFETVNLNFTGSADGVVEVVDFGAAKALNITSTTGKDLSLSAVTTATTAVVDATGSSDDLTIVFSTAIKSFAGSSETNVITLAASDLASTSTFTGGAASDDILIGTFGANQDAGIVNVSKFETVRLNISGANTIDLRNSADISTITVLAANAGTDDLTVNRLADGMVITTAAAFDVLTTSTQTGTSQSLKFTANVAVDNLVLDAATTSLTVISDDGDATKGEAMGSIGTDITGAALTTIIVQGGDDMALAGIPATVTTVDGSASSGIVTATVTNGTATVIKGGIDADVLTGAAGKDTITGGKGADSLSGEAGIDTYVFADTGANNGTDVFTTAGGANSIVVADDKLNLSAFGSITIEQNGGLGTAIVAFQDTAVTDVDITGKLVFLNDATNANTDDAVDEASEIAALIDGAGDVFSIQAGGKAIVIAGDTANDAGVAANNELLHIYYVHDANGDGDVADSNEVTKVGVSIVDFDLDTLTVSNFIL